MITFLRERRWDRISSASAIAIPILFALSTQAGLLEFLAGW